MNFELFISKLQDYNLESIDNDSISHILYKAEKLFSEVFNTADSIRIFIDKLIEFLIKTQDDENNFNETKHFINQCIFLSNQFSNDIFEWLKENQVEIKYIFFLRFLLFCNINFEENSHKAFELFLKALEKNHPITS